MTILEQKMHHRLPELDPYAVPYSIRKDTGLSYDDVLLVPKKGILEKRKDADISSLVVSSNVANIELPVPILSAPMTSVTGGEMALAMGRAGGMGIIHRFMSIEEQINEHHKIIDPMNETTWFRAGCAIGINEEYERVTRLYDEGHCRIFCLDVAHAHHDKVGDFLEKKPKFLDDVWWIVGNIATAEGARFLADYDIHAIKVGIGPGAACITREVTGFGIPQLSAIMEVAMELGIYDHKRPRIIADGGIKNSGDIVKALAAGVDTVMLGRLLAGADEAPHPGEYFGMASKRVNGHNAPEGAEIVVERTGSVKDIIKKLAWGVRSAISYAGAEDIRGLRENAEFIKVTAYTAIESGIR